MKKLKNERPSKESQWSTYRCVHLPWRVFVRLLAAISISEKNIPKLNILFSSRNIEWFYSSTNASRKKKTEEAHNSNHHSILLAVQMQSSTSTTSLRWSAMKTYAGTRLAGLLYFSMSSCGRTERQRRGFCSVVCTCTFRFLFLCTFCVVFTQRLCIVFLQGAKRRCYDHYHYNVSCKTT